MCDRSHLMQVYHLTPHPTTLIFSPYLCIASTCVILYCLHHHPSNGIRLASQTHPAKHQHHSIWAAHLTTILLHSVPWGRSSSPKVLGTSYLHLTTTQQSVVCTRWLLHCHRGPRGNRGDSEVWNCWRRRHQEWSRVPRLGPPYGGPTFPFRKNPVTNTYISRPIHASRNQLLPLVSEVASPSQLQTCSSNSMQFQPSCRPFSLAWKLALKAHPDNNFSTYIVEGIREGLHIRIDLEVTPTQQRNTSSAYNHPEVVTSYLAEVWRQNRILGPFPHPPVPAPHTSCFGVTLKHHQLNKWHMIVDLSSLEGHSINDGIDSSMCSLSYVSVNDIAASIVQLGWGELIAKTNIKHAYQQIPVHPQDRHLLGVNGRETFYGWLSAFWTLLIFSAVVDALEWNLWLVGCIATATIEQLWSSSTVNQRYCATSCIVSSSHVHVSTSIR